MEAKFETVTPVLAEQFLHCSAPNRPIRKKHVQVLAGAIQRGEWKANGEAIIFDQQGKMIDGQHRCNAVIKAGRSIKSLVVRGVEKGSFETIDSGAKRSNGDVLAMEGEANANGLAAILRFIAEMTQPDVVAGNPITTAQIRKTLGEHPGARDWARRYGKLQSRLGGGVAVCSVLCLIEERVGSLAVEFFERLVIGDGLSADSPILMLRNRIASDPVVRAGASAGRILTRDLVIRAWNCHARGEKIQRLVANKNDTIDNIVIPAVF
jgi:hypothetical protein